MTCLPPAHAPQRYRYRSVILGVATLLWSGALAGSLGALVRYDQTPGPDSLPFSAMTPETPEALQAPVAPAPHAQRPRLVMFAHPRCPCTRAGIAALAAIAAQADADVEVSFYRPAAEPDAWADGPSRLLAGAIAGARITTDPDGRGAARAGAITSGLVLLLDARNAVLFRGGLTPGRGQPGPGPGADALLALLHADPTPERTPAPVTAPVYGCRIAPADTSPCDTRCAAVTP